eukprot:comp22808_c0_seq1/m.57938 comp22808_c0_seq1/g.57938  ORF comp22808_c0_seq1/g.57938 comp22808_c0_seq1/m.57938 type:complete len:116 (-) comp22808_c0_seq1:145-492(-)
MARSSWKIPHVNSNIIEYVSQQQQILDLVHKQDPSDFNEMSETNNKTIATRFTTISRESVIPRALLGMSVQVYNGQKYLSFKIEADHLGKKFGEFAHTRKILSHKEVKKKQNKKK